MMPLPKNESENTVFVRECAGQFKSDECLSLASHDLHDLARKSTKTTDSYLSNYS